MWFRLIDKIPNKEAFGEIPSAFLVQWEHIRGDIFMKKFGSFFVRLIVLLAGIVLAGFLVWQLFTDATLLDVDVQTKGPVIVVIYSLIALISLGAGASFFTDKNLGSTIFLGAVLTVIALILWVQNQDLANIYRWYFIYGLLVSVLSPFFRKED